MMETVKFRLTEDQHQDVLPLLKKENEDMADSVPGIVMARIKRLGMQNQPTVTAVYIEKEYADRVHATVQAARTGAKLPKIPPESTIQCIINYLYDTEEEFGGFLAEYGIDESEAGVIITELAEMYGEAE